MHAFKPNGIIIKFVPRPAISSRPNEKYMGYLRIIEALISNSLLEKIDIVVFSPLPLIINETGSHTDEATRILKHIFGELVDTRMSSAATYSRSKAIADINRKGVFEHSLL